MSGKGILILDTMPFQESVSEKLRDVVNDLRSNDIIRRSNTLHQKGNKINTLTIMILKEIYTEEQLLKYLPQLPKYLTTQFYTVSYLKAVLKKIQKKYNIICPAHFI